MIAHIENPAAVKLLLTSAETCEALGVSRKTLYLLSAPRGPIPTVSIGKSGIRYSVATLQKWIAERQSAGATK